MKRSATSLLAAVALVVGATLGACSDDDESGSAASGQTEPPAHATTTSTPLDFGELELEVPDGYFPIPVPDAGFGLALPEGFEATLLSPEAIDRLGQSRAAGEGFVGAALEAADSGALLYAARVEPDGAVTDVKLGVRFGDDPDALLLSTVAEIEARDELADLAVNSDSEAGTARIRFTTAGPEDGPERAEGTQYLYRAPGAVWSLIITSEKSPDEHETVSDAIADTFVVTPP